jgi:sigma-B regulation protein RsbU (phosphoserine phosphatase)
MRLPFDENISLQEVISTKKPIVIPNSQSLLQTAASHEPNNPDNSTALLIVPLVTRGRVIGTIWMLAKDTGHEFTENDIDLSEIIASQMASAVDNARLYAQMEKALDVVERDLEIGRQIQSSFFPETVPKIQGYELVPYFQPARQVAGDFYDIFRIGDSNYIGIVIADVCDKGVGAALFMVLFRSLVRSFSEQFQQIEKTDISLPNIVAKINNYVALTHGHSNMFATMFYGILDPTTNNLTYVNGGNEPPVVIDSQGRIKSQLEPTGPAVGLMPDMDFNIGQLVFEPGDLLIAYTDGIPEAKNVNGDFYSEDRLLHQVSQPWSSAFSAVKQLEADLFDHIGDLPQFDDVTLVAVQREVEGQPKLHKIALEANLPNLPRMREFVVEACEQLGVNENVCFSVKLAVDEACTNLLQHGYKNTDPSDIHLCIEHLGHKLKIQIEDTGYPFHPDLAAPPDLELSLEDREPGGLGVYFMKEMVDEISYESKDGVNRLTIGMNL